MPIRFQINAPTSLKPFLKAELDSYCRYLKFNEYAMAWRHLERAHVVGQSFAWPHTYVHWKMLLFGIKIKNRKEILGQIPRLLVGGIKSFVGKVPLGNTGGANIPPLKPLEIEPEIQEIFRKCNIS